MYARSLSQHVGLLLQLAEAVCCLLQALLNERMAPDILQYKEELVQRVKDSLDRKASASCYIVQAGYPFGAGVRCTVPDAQLLQSQSSTMASSDTQPDSNGSKLALRSSYIVAVKHCAGMSCRRLSCSTWSQIKTMTW
jgi:hypothetical protein